MVVKAAGAFSAKKLQIGPRFVSIALLQAKAAQIQAAGRLIDCIFHGLIRLTQCLIAAEITRS